MRTPVVEVDIGKFDQVFAGEQTCRSQLVESRKNLVLARRTIQNIQLHEYLLHPGFEASGVNAFGLTGST
jgi:hypothetical protein